MKTLDQLKTDLFGKLKQSPAIEAFFKESLQKRVDRDDTWLENPLAVYVLDEMFKKDDVLVNWISTLAGSLPDYERMQKKLAGNDDYDQRMHDVLAEVRAYCDIKISGFTNIKAIPESLRKAPDFSAALNQVEYLFEVKNMRSPTDVQNLLWDKIFARRLLVPEKYANLQFDIRISHAWEEISFRAAKAACLKSNLLAWLEDFFLAVEAGQSLDWLSKKRFVAGEEDELWIECGVEEGPHFLSTGFSHARALDIDRKKELPPLLRKSVSKINEAASQLFEYDIRDECEKYVLLSFPYEGTLVLLHQEVLGIMNGLDSIVKNISDRLHVRWLHGNNLP